MINHRYNNILKISFCMRSSAFRNLSLTTVIRGVLLSSYCRAMSTASSKRAAVAQLCSTSNKLQNLLNVAKCAGWAKGEGASMLFLPECFGFMGTSSEQTLQEADPPVEVGITKPTSKNEDLVDEMLRTTVDCCAKGEIPEAAINESHPASQSKICILDGLKVIAKESGLWISGGGLHVAGAPPADGSDVDRVYNTHIILNNDGVVQCLYRKIHLFDVCIPDKVNLQESKTTAPGTDLVVCDSPCGRLGLATCYDVRFPEMFIPLVKMGAQILLVPSAFTVPTGSAHWHTLLKCRAIENQCYVLAAAQNGKHNEKRESYGHSLAIDPWGKVIADAGGHDGPGTSMAGDDGSAATITTPSIILCDIDKETLETTRQRMPIQQHRDSAKF